MIKSFHILFLLPLLFVFGCRDNVFVKRRDFDRRIDRKVDTSSPANPKTLVSLIESDENSSTTDPADTEEVLDEIYKTNKNDADAEKALFAEADELFKARKYRRAYLRFRVLIESFPRTKLYPQVIDRLFNIGRLALEEGSDDGSFITFFGETDEEFGVRVLDFFVYRFNRHPRADNSLYLIATHKLDDGSPEDAIELWFRLVEEYPDSEFIELSQLRVPLARLTITDDPRRDKSSMRLALLELRSFLAKYPDGDNFAIAKEVTDELEETLAQQELTVAKRYRRLLQASGYKIFLEHVIFEFPETEAAKEATVLLDLYNKRGAEHWGFLDRFGFFYD